MGRHFSTTTLFLLLFIFSSSYAQDRYYHVYIDSDNDTVTGCDVNIVDFATTLNGVDSRVTVTTNSATPPVITNSAIHTCQAGSFDAGVPINAAALGLNTGFNAADVFESSIDRNDLIHNSSRSMRVYFATESAAASDIVLTNGGGGPIVFGFPFAIPSLSFITLVFLALLLLIVSKKHLSRKLTVSVVLIGVTSVAIAMSIIVDGQTNDWMNIGPANTDPINDTSAAGSYADLTGVYLTFQDGEIFFRMDVVDVENQAPVANNAAGTTLEDNATTITVTGSDAEGSPVTFAVSTQPANGTLGAFNVVNNTTSTIQYTPNADFNGNDSFTFVANDGQVSSAPATASVTVTAVNDEPAFTSGGNVNHLKTGGPYNQTWATGVSAGAPDEAGQNLTFNILSNDNAAIFSTQPAINAAGVLSFEGVLNATGTANISVNLTDDGGTANGGDDTSVTVNFAITLQGVNDEPSFTAGPNQTVLEDAGAQNVAAWATNISAGPPDESGQTLTFNVIANDNPALFSVGPAVDPITGNLTYTSAADANGIANITIELMDDGGTANGGDDTSPPQNFSITVTAVNDAPSFTAGADESLLEGAGAQVVNGWATGISPGPADESGQTVSFNVTNDNNAMFSVQPAIDAAGTLTYTPTPTALGTATVSVAAMDNGGTANGGADTSAVQNFIISITAVNDPPSFDVGPNQTVLEDAGAQNVAAWATNILAGPPDEAGQTLTFNITANDNAALFAAGPAVASDGTLTYTPATDANGTANITLELMDDGGTANGGIDTSPPQNFSITVTAVNDAPSFTSGGNQNVLEESGPQTVNGWATAISPGPADEAGQTVNFNVSNNNNGLFSAQPAIDSSGNLSYTPAANTSGIATVTVTLSDNGGTANGGADTSAAQNFDIVVTGINDAPSFTAGANPAAVNEDSGAQSTAWASAISAGPPDEAGQTLTFILSQTSIDPTLSFSVAPSVNSTTGNVEYTAAANAYGSVSYDVVLMDNGGTANGGVDTSSPAVPLTITINPLNDPPSVTPPGPFSVTPNIRISVPDGANDLLANATDAETGTTLTIQGTGTIVTANGGTVTVNNSTGAFTYDPPAGFIGSGASADTFDYQVCDDGIPLPAACSGMVTVNLNVTGNVVWFVDNLAAAGGDGTLQTPFDSLADFNTSAAAAGHYVYVATGTGTYNEAGINLANNQTLFGEGTTGAFDTIAGITPSALSIARPTLGGARPLFTSSANGINLAANNTIRGVNVGNTSGFGLTGGTVGNLTVSEVSVTGSGGALRVTGSGNFAANVTFDLLESNTATSSGIDLTAVSGTLAVTSAGAGITNSFGSPAVRFNAGTASMSYPGSIANTNGRSVEATGNTGGTLSFNGLIDDDGQGIWLVGNAGTTMNFASLDLDTTTFTGLTATGGGTINITGTANTIDTTTGAAININNTTIGASGVNLRSVSANGGLIGIHIVNSGATGPFNITGVGTTGGSGGTIQNTTQNGILIENANNITLSNMNLTNAADEAGGGCTPSTFATCVGSLEFDTVTNITINNMLMSGSDEHGLFAQNISNIDINNSTFTNLGNPSTPEHAIFIRNLAGTGGVNGSVFDSVTVSNTGDTGILVENTTATGQLTVQGASSFTSLGEQGIILVTDGAAANLTSTIGNASAVGVGDTVTFSGLGAAAVVLNNDSGSMTAVVQNSLFNAGGSDLPNAIQGSSQGLLNNSSLNVQVSGNDITIPDAVGTGRGGISFNADQGPGGLGSVGGLISNNTINSPEVTVFGIFVSNNGNSTQAQNSWDILNNTINLTATGVGATTDGISVESHNATSSPGKSVTISGNNVTANGASGFTGGVELLVGVNATPNTNFSTVCTNIFNNNISAPNADLGGFTTPGEADIVAASFGMNTVLSIAGAAPGPITEVVVDTTITGANFSGDTTVFPNATAGTYAGIVSCP